tara:strand:+ start:175 stop:501 length:327 start_codon:yes stop_codon:yes gene_type:complete
MAEESKLAEKYENATKFSEKEMEKIKSFQDKYVTIQRKFGQGAINKIRLEQSIELLNKEMSELRKEYTELQKEETTFVDSVTKKYGEGTLNPETGEFQPNSEEKVENK